MGRLFWKFFLFIWLGQVVAIFGIGAFLWLEREQLGFPDQGPPPEHRFEGRFPAPPPHFDERPPPDMDRPGPRPGGHVFPGPRGIPYKHLLTGLLASLLCAAGLAWYIARPIRQLRRAFAAAAAGQLETTIGAGMGGRRDELADLGQDFDHMMAQLRALMSAQQRLLHDVSHEMRSPLARLQAAIGLARQQPARTADSMDRIEREAERMNRLVGELLSLSRLEAGAQESRDIVEVGELLEVICDDARFEVRDRDLTVDLAAEPDLLVRANPELLQRAIENVVRNALRFSPPGGVVRLEGRIADSDCCLIRIADNGPGVDPDQLSAIFQPFFRSAAPAGTPSSEGYGLGLAIARRVVLTVDGQIEAKNRPEGGLLVEIRLPRVGA